MIWKQEYNTREINSLGRDTMLENIGIKFLEIGDDYITASMPVDKRTVQPLGLLHGGASMALAETLGSVASMLCLDDPTKQAVVGLSINGNHLKAKKEGLVIGGCNPIKVGNTIHVWHIEIFDEEEEMISICRLTTKIVSKK